MTARAVLYTAMALVAFAANSVLCRVALRSGASDPWTFSAVRLVCGALVLLPLARTLEGRGVREGSWTSAAALCVYAVGFSLAYLSLDAGTGALILFGAVQATMIGAGIALGERPGWRQGAGLIAAAAGLITLVSPGIAAPRPPGALLMGAAGVAWGLYSLRGRGQRRPIASTAGNFLRAAPPALALWALAMLASARGHATWTGLLLAAASGALTSGLGYVVWYAALRELSASTAGVVQLAVPALAAVGGVLFLGEQPTPRLALSGALILGGVALAVTSRRALRSGERP